MIELLLLQIVVFSVLDWAPFTLWNEDLEKFMVMIRILPSIPDRIFSKLCPAAPVARPGICRFPLNKIKKSNVAGGLWSDGVGCDACCYPFGVLCRGCGWELRVELVFSFWFSLLLEPWIKINNQKELLEWLRVESWVGFFFLLSRKRQNSIRRNPRGNPGGPNFERPYLGQIAVTRAEN